MKLKIKRKTDTDSIYFRNCLEMELNTENTICREEWCIA